MPSLPTTMRESTPIAFVDLAAQHAEVRDEIEAAFRRILDTSQFVGGSDVDEFERAFGAFLGVDHVVGVSNGTDAVRIALEVAGVERGDAIVTVSHTFIGTVEGAVQMGCLPLFVDVDAARTMDPAALERLLTERCTRAADGTLRHDATGRRIGAILPVHLYGQAADMEPILGLGARFGVPVVEDAAQAQGATYRFADGRVACCGAMGAAAAFSFYPGKNLGALGEAGAVSTGSAEAARRARLLRDHGQAQKYVHEIAHGSNARLDAIQAAVLTIKLRRLAEWNEARRATARAYEDALAGLPLRLPRESPRGKPVYHLYVVEVDNRDELQRALGERSIQTGLHYPIPLHLQPAFADLPSPTDALVETERAASRCLSVPMHPHVTRGEVERVAGAMRAILG